MSRVVQAPDGCKGFDANVRLDSEGASAWAAKGFRFAMRYVPRKGVGASSHDLSSIEVQTIHDAGMAVGIVQHVEPENWVPTPEKGRAYGWYAATASEDCGIPPGASLFCDLEGVLPGTPAELVISYVEAWHREVQSAGFRSGLYVGWSSILTADQLFHRLSVNSYWLAYNANADQIPLVRGVCMKQHELPNADRPAGYQNMDGIDGDVVQRDNLGGFPWVYAPEGWAAP